MPTSERSDKPEHGLAHKTISPSDSGSINLRPIAIGIDPIGVDENFRRIEALTDKFVFHRLADDDHKISRCQVQRLDARRQSLILQRMSQIPGDPSLGTIVFKDERHLESPCDSDSGVIIQTVSLVHKRRTA